MLLDKDAVEPWLTSVLSEPRSTAGDVDGVPRLAVLQAGVQLAGDLGVDFDGPRVAKDIETHREGSKYRDSPGTETNWAATATAVAILTELRQPIPALVEEGIRKEIKQREGSAPEVDEDSISLASAASRLKIDTGTWGRELSRSAVAQSHEVPSAAAVPMLRALGLDVQKYPALSSLCTFVATREANATTDPHLVADIHAIGCDYPTVEVPPHTSSGWPNERAISDAMRSSVYGMELAAALDASDRYQKELRRQYQEWDTGDAVDESTWAGGPSLMRLAQLLGVENPKVAHSFKGVLSSGAEGSGAEDLPALEMARLMDASESSQIQSRQRSALSGIETEASNNAEDLELAALLAWVKKRDLEPEVLESFCQKSVCATRKGDSPSLSATVFAYWNYSDGPLPHAL